MRTLLILYDLRTPGKDYSKLWEYLKSYGNFAKPLESFWLVRTNYSAEQVRNLIIGNYVDQNDRIFVIDVTARASAWKNISAAVVSWIGSSL